MVLPSPQAGGPGVTTGSGSTDSTFCMEALREEMIERPGGSAESSLFHEQVQGWLSSMLGVGAGGIRGAGILKEEGSGSSRLAACNAVPAPCEVGEASAQQLRSRRVASAPLCSRGELDPLRG